MIHGLSQAQHDLKERQPSCAPGRYACGSVSPTVVLQRGGQQITCWHYYDEEMKLLFYWYKKNRKMRNYILVHQTGGMMGIFITSNINQLQACFKVMGVLPVGLHCRQQGATLQYYQYANFWPFSTTEVKVTNTVLCTPTIIITQGCRGSFVNIMCKYWIHCPFW